MRERRYEYGGYLGLELPQRREYFDYLPESDVLRVNCGRTAFYCAVRAANVRKIYCPYLNCANSIEPMELAGIDVEYYLLDEELTPKGIEPREDEAVLWINYYGNATNITKQKVCTKFPKLVIDNCQAFFSAPFDRAYNCYSARKFFGVADGAYLIHPNIGDLNFDLPESSSAAPSQFLMQTIEFGTNAVYKENLLNEQRLERNLANMSLLTQRILSSVDYTAVRDRRQKNILKLHENLKHINQFDVNTDTRTQMYYPLLVEQDSLRERLVQNRIYTPTWWKHVPKQCNYSKIETRLSMYMVLLPIDQRYDASDMDTIAEIVCDALD